MAGRRTNLALMALLIGALFTGALAYATGTGWARLWVIAHGVVGLGIVALAPWKSVIVRRGLARRRRGWVISLAFALLVAVAITFGILHATGLVVALGEITSLQIHVGAALLAIALGLLHVLAKRVRMQRTDLTRRNLLRTGALLGATGVAYGAVEGLVRATSLPGADRRFTGSYETGSFRPEDMPVTQWLNDSVPSIDSVEWRLTVGTGSAAVEWTYDELAGFDDKLRATIDCTGGWFAEQDWEGVRLSRLFPDVGEARSLSVGSTTGYGRRFPVRDLPNLLLATRVGGVPLSPGHGFPARIVAPGRRGFWWVKWVQRMELSTVPWWWQPPFPVT
ncbi:MAG TPA: molybdopterin-dependent oxidoreductase [Acidimicrobiia bacterium]